MSSNDEYNNLVRKQSNVQGQIDSCEDTISDLSKKIEKLELAKSFLNTAENELKKVKKSTKKEVEAKYSWAGTNYSSFQTMGQNVINANDTYWSNVDCARDAICDEINRLENERNKQYGILGGLMSLFNSLGNEIEKLVNNTKLV